MKDKTAKVSSTAFVHGLETFVPENGAVLVLCENQSGPYCKTEDYERMEGRLEADIESMRTLLKAWHLVGKLYLSRKGALPDHCQRELFDRTARCLE